MERGMASAAAKPKAAAAPKFKPASGPWVSVDPAALVQPAPKRKYRVAGDPDYRNLMDFDNKQRKKNQWANYYNSADME